MATQIPQFILQDLIPYFARVKQRLVASDTQSPAVEEEESEEFKEAEDDGAASCTSAEQESVFDGAEDTASTSPSEVGLVNPPAVVPAAGIWYTRKDLTDLLSFIAQRVSLEHLQKLHIAAGLGPVVISRLDILTLKACVVSGARHTFQEDHRCLRCDRQLCSSCRHSILSQCTRFASPDSAALVGCHRHNSIAASRISSTCHNTACIDNHPITTHRCECMEKLLSATNVRNMEIDGFYHCEECLTYSLADMRVHNMTRLEFITPQGLEILAVCLHFLDSSPYH
ncbi:hypothetical protein BKA65DRAFT_119625 [Rhexocercosporidium sp. MPI-PUGE-AT-0058]|nr:hypothetical protein BKA65DRAFT_119625 [Rhexocercosporidium sp. MPI-PUGE-AT-0058]